MSPDSLIFQSTLSVRRATRHLALAPLVLRISIHALRKESDKAIRSRMALWLFQSTLSVRRATLLRLDVDRQIFISIHALRKESDLKTMFDECFRVLFQSTLSVRRATVTLLSDVHAVVISIHALRKESDRMGASQVPRTAYFNPRSP